MNASAPMREVVEMLGGTIGERNVTRPGAYAAAAEFIERSLPAAARQTFDAGVNIESELRGSDEIVVVGAHYDSVIGSPGADDNATGVAGVIELARRFNRLKPSRTLRFVAFANEEPPHFGTPAMGSWQYARRCHERGEKIVAMVNLESIGFYSDGAKSQQYPALLDRIYPPVANFIAFVSNLRSRKLLRQCVRAFKTIPVESGALPKVIPGVAWSDQWAFWEFGYRAVMVTDTAPYRNPHYHTMNDKPHTIDYARLDKVVDGLEAVIANVANA